mgnify:CR=1 FL=1
MDILIEISKYVEMQKKVFCMMPFQNDFNNGIIEGLNLVSTYINLRIEREGKAIAEALDGK